MDRVVATVFWCNEHRIRNELGDKNWSCYLQCVTTLQMDGHVWGSSLPSGYILSF